MKIYREWNITFKSFSKTFLLELMLKFSEHLVQDTIDLQ